MSLGHIHHRPRSSLKAHPGLGLEAQQAAIQSDPYLGGTLLQLFCL